MKKSISILLFSLIIIFNSIFPFAGIDDSPRPDTIDSAHIISYTGIDDSPRPD